MVSSWTKQFLEGENAGRVWSFRDVSERQRLALLAELQQLEVQRGARPLQPDLPSGQQVAARDAGAERFVWVAGLAEPYAPAYFSAGATGFTSGLVNVAPLLSLAMLGALRAGDHGTAMAVWERIRRFEELRAADGSAANVSVVKEALAVLGLCRRDVRPPSSVLPEPVRAEVAQIVAGWGR